MQRIDKDKTRTLFCTGSSWARITLGFIMTWSFDAHAELFFEEDFNYPNGKLEAVTGGNWTLQSNSINDNVGVFNGHYLYDHVTPSTPAITSTYHRALIHGVPQGSTVYLAFDLTAEERRPASNSGTSLIHLLSDLGSAPARRAHVFIGANNNEGDFQEYQVGVRNVFRSGDTNFFHPQLLVLGDTYHIVVCFQDHFPTPTNSMSTLWVDPTSTNDPGISETTGNVLVHPLNKIVLRNRTDRDLGNFVLDNIRVRSTFEEAVLPGVNQVDDGGRVIQWASIPEACYEIQSADTLLGDNWQTRAVVIAQETVTAWGDTSVAPSNLFYRVRLKQ